MVGIAEAPKMTKRARWEKIKTDLLKTPEKYPEIIAIALDVKSEIIQIITEPISAQYELKMYEIARNLRLKYGLDLANFYIYNLSDFNKLAWKDIINPGYKVIYER